MIEAAEASIIMLDAMIARLMRSTLRSELASDAADTLEYRKRSFQSTLLRLHSLEKRMSNVIQLSFNLVTQADSGVMKADSAVLKTDSRAMKFIAFLTLVFLPATGVASVFSTPFFDVDWDSPDAEDKVLRTAKSFWIFWAVVLPLTLAGLLLCFAWVNLPENYKFKIKTYIGKLAKSRRERRLTRRNSRGLGRGDIERGVVADV
jgi:Mg2+ and Co2+ transporter CorA